MKTIKVFFLFIFLVFFLADCASNRHGTETRTDVLSPEASDIRTGKDDPPPDAKELQPVTATDGAGCGVYGYRGTYERAYIRLKNAAARLGANYIQILRISAPHLSGGCFVNEFSITGMAYRVSLGQGSSRGPTASSGTCFSVAPDGLVLTAYHIIKDANTITIRFSDGKEITATPEQVSPNNDLALLRVHRPTPLYLSLSPQSPKLGEAVFTLGFPAPNILGTEPKFTEGSVSALSGPSNESTFLQVSVPVQPGNSGGPLVNYRGEVVGVITSTAAILPFLQKTGTLPQNINFAIKSGYASLLFTSPPPSPSATDRDNVIRRVREALCAIKCTSDK